ncbi:MAG: SDR family oxidoreductase [Candidatus Bathyarchaeia archaeon]
MFKGLRALVTGGAGFIGSHITDELIEMGCEVFVVDNMFTGKLENIKHLADNRLFHFIKGDVRDLDFAKKAVKNAEADVVFHQAALVSVSRSIEDPQFTNEVNVGGTLNLLLACLDSNVDYFIYASSSSVYGETGKLPKDELQPSNPISPYGVSKMAAENYVRVFHEVYGLNTVSLRYFNVYGPRQTYGPYSGVISIFVNRLLRNEPPIIYGDGEQMRDFTYVKDVAKANLLAMNNKRAVGEVFNVATGKPTTIKRLAEILLEITGKKHLNPIYAEPRPGDIKQSYADISKAKEILRYFPEVSLEEGLRKFVNWHKTIIGTT